jgi:glutamate-1-semialdehyde aminotransferase
MSIVFAEDDPHRLRMIRTYYQQELLKEGIVTYHGIFLPSYAHSQDDLVRTLEAADRVFRKLFNDIDMAQIERALEIPLLPDR